MADSKRLTRAILHSFRVWRVVTGNEQAPPVSEVWVSLPGSRERALCEPINLVRLRTDALLKPS